MQEDRSKGVLTFAARTRIASGIGVYGDVIASAVETLTARRAASVPARIALETFPRCAHQMNPLSLASHSGIVNVPSPLSST